MRVRTKHFAKNSFTLWLLAAGLISALLSGSHQPSTPSLKHKIQTEWVAAKKAISAPLISLANFNTAATEIDRPFVLVFAIRTQHSLTKVSYKANRKARPSISSPHSALYSEKIPQPSDEDSHSA